MPEQPGMGQELHTTAEQSQDPVEARHEVIDALKEKLEPMTDQELAAATSMDTETVRETLTDLADKQIVEVTYQNEDPASGSLEGPETPPDQMTGRLSAL